MWTQDTKQGKVRYFERGYDSTGKKRLFSVTLPDRKKATQKLAVELLHAKMNNQPKSKFTFGEMLTRYKEYLSREMKNRPPSPLKCNFEKSKNTSGAKRSLMT